MSLKDKICLVTGAASGIRHGISEPFVADGALVAIADLYLEAAQAEAVELSRKGPGRVAGFAMDVGSEDQGIAGIAAVEGTRSPVDVLVSSGCIQIVHPLEEYPFADWKKLMAIHLDGGFLTTKACLPAMYKRRSAVILYMGSVHSKWASPLKSAYVAAKYGLLGLARVVHRKGRPCGPRKRHLPRFRENPSGGKRIPQQAKSLGISEKEVVEKIMLGETVDKEFTTIEDVVNVACFLAAFPTNALTGQSMTVSHGWHMG